MEDRNYSVRGSKANNYKTSITRRLEGKKKKKRVVPLKHLSNFGKTLDIQVTVWEINLILIWSENNCVIRSKAIRNADPDADPVVAAVNNPTNATFKIKDTKLYVPVVTLPTEDGNKLLEQLKTVFKRTIKWDKYTLKVTKEAKTKNLNFLIDPTFSIINRLFVLSFENEGDITSFSKYHTPNVAIKDFKLLIDGKSFFDVPIKNKEEKYEKNIVINKNNDYNW